VKNDFRQLTTALILLALGTTAAALAQEVGPPASQWTVPTCSTVAGTAAVTFTLDEGATLTPTSRQLQGTSYTAGLAALDTPNTLLAAVGSNLLRSTDAGCRWSPLANLGAQSGNALLTLTAAPGGRAYAWADNGSALFRIDGRTVTAIGVPVSSIMGLAVDPADRAHVRIGDSTGQLWEVTADGGRFSPLGTPPVAGAFAYRAAFDPRNLDHVVLGVIGDGSYVTFDGGRSWTRASGHTAPDGRANIFNAVISPVDGQVVWAEGIDLTELDSGAANQGRHVFRSLDGGLTYTKVVEQSPEVTLVNGPTMAAHPTDPDVLYFVFGASFQGTGTYLYRYDAATGQVTWTHNSYHGIKSTAFNPASPAVMYLGLVHEQIQ
jgi:photosystem II stability/assembly factor-like uncharacterized protein